MRAHRRANKKKNANHLQPSRLPRLKSWGPRARTSTPVHVLKGARGGRSSLSQQPVFPRSSHRHTDTPPRRWPCCPWRQVMLRRSGTRDLLDPLPVLDFFFFFFITQRLLKAPVTRLGVSSSARHGLPEAHRPSVESTFLRPCIPEAQFFSCQSVPRTPQEPARPRPHVSSAFGAPGPAPCAGRHTGSARFLAGKHYGGCLTRCRSAGRGRSGRQ